MAISAFLGAFHSVFRIGNGAHCERRRSSSGVRTALTHAAISTRTSLLGIGLLITLAACGGAAPSGTSTASIGTVQASALTGPTGTVQASALTSPSARALDVGPQGPLESGTYVTGLPIPVAGHLLGAPRLVCEHGRPICRLPGPQPGHGVQRRWSRGIGDLRQGLCRPVSPRPGAAQPATGTVSRRSRQGAGERAESRRDDSDRRHRGWLPREAAHANSPHEQRQLFGLGTATGRDQHHGSRGAGYDTGSSISTANGS